MKGYQFSTEDLVYIHAKGISEEEVSLQLENFVNGFPSIVLDAPATVENGGIFCLTEEEKDFYVRYYEENSQNNSIIKFVPASGAATRMFKDLYAFFSAYNGNPSTIGKYPSVKVFFDNLATFAFFEDLKAIMKAANWDIDECLKNGDYKTIISFLLDKEHLAYGELPKALLKFHKYPNASRTALFEHFTEAMRYGKSSNGSASLHFTISEKNTKDIEHEVSKSRKYFSRVTDMTFHVKLSTQKHSTDTIAVDENNEPIRDENGNLVFRPGGHGALIGNLNRCKADLVFIKNIDNVVPDNPTNDYDSVTVRYKKMLGGLLLYLRSRVYAMTGILENKPSKDDIERIEDFMQNSLSIDLSRIKKGNFSLRNRATMLLEKLNRPMRVCGMVKNEGEPGGGPFWVINGDGTRSLQIVETSQINRNKPDQEEILSKSTHFNPVDLVVSARKRSGRFYNLEAYVDPTTGFITKKSIGAKVVKSQELPGLWNGAMADWITVFVEVPLETFNPVKTVNDLLRKEHL